MLELNALLDAGINVLPPSTLKLYDTTLLDLLGSVEVLRKNATDAEIRKFGTLVCTIEGIREGLYCDSCLSSIFRGSNGNERCRFQSHIGTHSPTILSTIVRYNLDSCYAVIVLSNGTCSIHAKDITWLFVVLMTYAAVMVADDNNYNKSYFDLIGKLAVMISVDGVLEF